MHLISYRFDKETMKDIFIMRFKHFIERNINYNLLIITHWGGKQFSIIGECYNLIFQCHGSTIGNWETIFIKYPHKQKSKYIMSRDVGVTK